MPITDHLKTTDELLDFMVQRLNGSQWHTYLPEYGADYGKDYSRIPKNIPAIRLPAAVIQIPEAKFGSNPRRTVVFDVILCVRQSDPALLTLSDQMAALLDETKSGDAVFRLQSMTPVSICPGMKGMRLRFHAEEH